MKFNDKYLSVTEKANQKAEDVEKNQQKTLLSDDAFALGEMLQLLTDKLEHVRLNLMMKR